MDTTELLAICIISNVYFSTKKDTYSRLSKRKYRKVGPSLGYLRLVLGSTHSLNQSDSDNVVIEERLLGQYRAQSSVVISERLKTKRSKNIENHRSSLPRLKERQRLQMDRI